MSIFILFIIDDIIRVVKNQSIFIIQKMLVPGTKHTSRGRAWNEASLVSMLLAFMAGTIIWLVNDNQAKISFKLSWSFTTS